MKNFVQCGDVLDYIPTSDVASGAVVIIGTMIGVAGSDIPANTLGTAAVEGVFDLPKKAVGAIAMGAKLTWSVASGGFTVGAGVTGDTLGGAIAAAAAADGATTVRVKLAPGTGSTV